MSNSVTSVVYTSAPLDIAESASYHGLTVGYMVIGRAELASYAAMKKVVG